MYRSKCLKMIIETARESIVQIVMYEKAVLELDEVLDLQDFKVFEEGARGGIKFSEFDGSNGSLLESNNFLELGIKIQ